MSTFHGRRRRSIDFLPFRPNYYDVQEGMSRIMKRRGSMESVVAFQRARTMQEENDNDDTPYPAATVSIASSPRISRRNSLETIKMLACDRAQIYNEKDDSSCSSSTSSLEDSILSLGKATYQSSSSTGLSYSELLERCSSPKEMMKWSNHRSRRCSLGSSFENNRGWQQQDKAFVLLSGENRKLRRSSLDMSSMNQVSASSVRVYGIQFSQAFTTKKSVICEPNWIQSTKSSSVSKGTAETFFFTAHAIPTSHAVKRSHTLRFSSTKLHGKLF